MSGSKIGAGLSALGVMPVVRSRKTNENCIVGAGVVGEAVMAFGVDGWVDASGGKARALRTWLMGFQLGHDGARGLTHEALLDERPGRTVRASFRGA